MTRVNKESQIDDNAEKVINTIEKINLLYKRIVIVIIIVILLIFIAIDTAIVKQTIKSKDYIETTAVLVDRKESDEPSIFDDYTYTFEDKEGKKQEIVYSISKEEQPEQEIKIRYNEKDPQDYYSKGQIMDKSGLIWYIVKIVAVILLVILFFSEKILKKIGISLGNNNRRQYRK